MESCIDWRGPAERRGRALGRAGVTRTALACNSEASGVLCEAHIDESQFQQDGAESTRSPETPRLAAHDLRRVRLTSLSLSPSRPARPSRTGPSILIKSSSTSSTHPLTPSEWIKRETNKSLSKIDSKEGAVGESEGRRAPMSVSYEPTAPSQVDRSAFGKRARRGERESWALALCFGPHRSSELDTAERHLHIAS